MPDPTDLSPVVDEQKKTTKAIDKMRGVLEEMPTGGGSGGAGIGSFLDTNNALPTSSPALATRLDTSNSPILYLGKSPIGSATSDAVWQISKLDTSSGLVKTWADGNSDFDNVWDDILTITYS